MTNRRMVFGMERVVAERIEQVLRGHGDKELADELRGALDDDDRRALWCRKDALADFAGPETASGLDVAVLGPARTYPVDQFSPYDGASAEGFPVCQFRAAAGEPAPALIVARVAVTEQVTYEFLAFVPADAELREQYVARLDHDGTVGGWCASPHLALELSVEERAWTVLAAGEAVVR